MKYHDNILSISYAELTDGNPEDPDVSQRPIMTVAIYRYLTTNKKIKIVRRGCFGQSALIAYHTLPEKYKAKVEAKYGDVEAQAARLNLRDQVVRDVKAEVFFEQYMPDGHNHLSEKIQQRYVMNASVLNAVIALMDRRIQWINARGRNSGRVLKEISDELNTIQDEMGCKLPKNHQALKRVIDRYRSEGYGSLISKKHGNDNASASKTDEQSSLMIELLGDGRNINYETTAKLYNAVAVKMGWKTVTAGTIANFHRKHSEVNAGRFGSRNFKNESLMQVKRIAPSCPMYFWTSDGWDAELFYQKTYRNEEGKQVTTYHNRPTVVMVIDPFNWYIIGYAIGTHETPQLIRAAFRNAFEHVYELLGDYYKPWQVQTDNYGKGNLTGFYKGLTQYYTPAAVGNAKSKIAEPFFRQFNDKYLRTCVNSSGYGVKSRGKLQVSDDWISAHKKSFPDFDGVVRQLEQFIEFDRRTKHEAYLKGWENTATEDRLLYRRSDWLYSFGEVAQPRKLQPDGVTLQIDNERWVYDCYDPEFRNYGHRTFFLHYDPNDMSTVLAVENAGTKAKPEAGTARFILQEKVKVHMAIKDRDKDSLAELSKIRQFNEDMQNTIILKRTQSAENVMDFLEKNEDKLRGTLTAHVITDSLGQHKNRRNELRAAPLEIKTEDEMATQKPTAGNDDDYSIAISENDFLNDF